ncbi:MAG TPA: hypothetical protein PKM25_06515, partial [Candidatus Ozemobacteraceae bacterium]|nr:hypothetical protein [Candidatus Ozemobacteraceae bacterium]
MSRWVLVLLMFSLFPCAGSSGWDCNEAHPAINELAGKLFVIKSQSDSFGDKYKRAPVEFRSLFNGFTFKKGGMSEKTADKIRIDANFIEWLRRGGHDADIPEIVMGFRHFYDRVYEPRYLTWLIRRIK